MFVADKCTAVMGWCWFGWQGMIETCPCGVIGQRPERVRDPGICAASPVGLPFGMEFASAEATAFARLMGVLQQSRWAPAAFSRLLNRSYSSATTHDPT